MRMQARGPFLSPPLRITGIPLSLNAALQGWNAGRNSARATPPFFAGQGSLETGMRVTVHPRLPSEQRQVALKNRSNRRLTCQLLFYFEPCLARREDAAAHPAFSRLFLSVRRDEASSALFFTRRQRQGEPPVCLAAGLLDGGPFDYEPSRERLLTRPEGTLSLGEEMGRPFSCQGAASPTARPRCG